MTMWGAPVNVFLTRAPNGRHCTPGLERAVLSGVCVLRLLVVEDEPFIALDLQMLSASAGHDVVGIADSLQSAIDMAASETPEAALVDINLRDGFSGIQVSRALSSGGCRAIGFVTGNTEQIPPDFAGAVAVLEKPYTQAGVEEILAILQSACNDPPGTPDKPRYVKLAGT